MRAACLFSVKKSEIMQQPNPPYLLHLSQAHLNLLATCPPRFQYIYLDRLASYLKPESQEKQAWGTRFHLLMQQRELGLNVDSLLQEDAEMLNSLHALLQIAPEIFRANPGDFREAEHSRTLQKNGYLLTVVYDLLIANDREAKIYDWKTYLQPPNTKELANNWQTRLYLYVLAETSNYLPEQISFTYWFVKLPHKPQSICFHYNSQQHQKNEADLSNLLQQLDRWLKGYTQEQIPLQHLPSTEAKCPFCNGGSESLDRGAKTPPDWSELIAQIPEISL